MILKMRRRNVRLIVDVKAPPVGLHDVAGKTEVGLLGALKMFGKSPGPAQNGHCKKRHEGKNFATDGSRQRKTRQDYENQYNRRSQQNEENNRRAWHDWTYVSACYFLPSS